jgi:hypothetical protein
MTRSASLGGDTHGAGLFDPLLGSKRETVETGLNSKPVEFDGIRLGVIEPLRDPKEFNSMACLRDGWARFASGKNHDLSRG